MKEGKLTCLCGEDHEYTTKGNNHADVKFKCICNRNITIHFRRDLSKKPKYGEPKYKL